jgi:hypothetical protein
MPENNPKIKQTVRSARKGCNFNRVVEIIIKTMQIIRRMRIYIYRIKRSGLI